MMIVFGTKARILSQPWLRSHIHQTDINRTSDVNIANVQDGDGALSYLCQRRPYGLGGTA